jgi:hypothetical protein
MLTARENPFSTDRVLRVRYRFSADDWAQLRATLVRHHGRGALVGAKGSGKTTLLEDLAIRLRHEGRDVTLIRLCAEFPRLPGAFNRAFFASLAQGDAVLLDGAEQLPFVKWLWFRWRTRKAGIVVVTTHRGGRLRTLHRCTTSPVLLRKLVLALGQDLGVTEAETLHRRHRGNIREAMRELYDRSSGKHTGALSFPGPRA